jgi:Lrp/AsnC family transcriptional regulator, leucine-responsive regulatory protein
VDVVLILNVASLQKYQALARRIFAEHPNLKWFKALMTLDRVKLGPEVPVS